MCAHSGAQDTSIGFPRTPGQCIHQQPKATQEQALFQRLYNDFSGTKCQAASCADASERTQRLRQRCVGCYVGVTENGLRAVSFRTVLKMQLAELVPHVARSHKATSKHRLSSGSTQTPVPRGPSLKCCSAAVTTWRRGCCCCPSLFCSPGTPRKRGPAPQSCMGCLGCYVRSCHLFESHSESGWSAVSLQLDKARNCSQICSNHHIQVRALALQKLRKESSFF